MEILVIVSKQIYIYSTNIFTKWVEVEFEVKAYPYINGTYMKKFM